jgi:hypothetical protein
MNLKTDTWYTISGYLTGKGIVFIEAFGGKDRYMQQSMYNNEAWFGRGTPIPQYFKYSFKLKSLKLEEELPANTELSCALVLANGYNENSSYSGWFHLKLEEGTTVTPWCDAVNDTQARMDINNNYILAEVVSKDGGSANGFGWHLDADGFILYKKSEILGAETGTPVFKCDENGINITGSGTFTGNITAEAGKIGGWEIGSDYIISHGTDTSFYLSSAKQTNDENWICAYDKELEDTFKVTKKGALYATGADISGKITAEEGIIGGWTISSDEQDNNVPCLQYEQKDSNGNRIQAVRLSMNGVRTWNSLNPTWKYKSWENIVE